jgi:hypothetical protein
MRGSFQTLLILVLLAGCDGEPNGGRCTRDTECPPGQRCADAICTPVVKFDTGPVADLGPTLDHRLGEAARLPDLPASDALQCMANHDDKIDRSEMPIAVGAKIHYSVGTGLTVDLKGKLVTGRTQWDLTAAASDDHPIVSELLAVPSWVASAYPGATYSALLDESYGSYGVFKATPSALQLIGVVSQQADKIKLSYSKPIDMLRFPIAPSDSFTTDATVTGWMNSLYLWNLESYAVEVLGAGDLALPKLTLPVVLVKVKVEQTPYQNPFLATSRHLFMFISECYGIVAQIVADGDPKDKLEAVKAKERRRLSM